MGRSQTTLVNKKIIAPNIFELHYTCPENFSLLPGQFITFIIPNIGGRSYSILEIRDGKIVLLVKRWSEEMGGTGGSIYLCDMNIGSSAEFLGAIGHFVLQETRKNKIFIGTGTGFVPLYNMITSGLIKKNGEKYQLVFGVRYMEDFFYRAELETLKEKYPKNFYYHLVVSREEGKGIVKNGYVGDFLSQKVVNQYGEFYICGAPKMVESVESQLKDLGVSQEKIFFEKYN